MIQRIQTFFLVLSTALLALLFRLPLAEISANGVIYVFDIMGVHNAGTTVFSGLPLVIFLSLVVLLHIFVIFSFKKRIRQIRILTFTIILLAGLCGLFFYFAYAALDDSVVSFKVPVVFPVVAIILDYLAVRSIGRDEALVRSVDRLRP
ncbi:MAG: DUF4293 domain-containing protein [Prolixibacteraceae bacterium]|nr:DUF4293 domain-containing protein [Prolixibacteraceae bacterium]